jgi:hypothetical protein
MKEEKKEEKREDFSDSLSINKELINLVDDILKLKVSPYKYDQASKKYNKMFIEILNKMNNPIPKQLLNINFFNDLKTSQKTLDFFPTPLKCLEPIKQDIKEASSILEPSFGYGHILYYIMENIKKLKNIQISGFELNNINSLLLKYINPKININPDNINNFLNYKPTTNDYDLIICNPPFTNNNDKRFYINFLFHCLYILKNSKSKNTPILYFISPPILDHNDMNNNEFNFEDLFNKNNSYIATSKLKLILSSYDIKVNLNKLRPLINTSEEFNKIDDIFGFFRGQFIGLCEDFIGTKIKANMYKITLYRNL